MGKYHSGDNIWLGGTQYGTIDGVVEIVGDVYYPNGLYSIKTLDGKQIYAEEDFLDSLQDTKVVPCVGQISGEDYKFIFEENYR